MIHKKMLITLSVATIAAAGMGGYLLTPVFAQNSTNNTVFDMVVQKLDLQNVSGSQLKDAFESSRKDFHVSKQSAKIDEAELKGKLTEDQAALAKKVFEYMQTNRPEKLEKPNFSDMKGSEIKEKKLELMREMEKVRKEIHDKMLIELSITEEQFKSLMEVLNEAGLKGRGHGKMGMDNGGTMRGFGHISKY